LVVKVALAFYFLNLNSNRANNKFKKVSVTLAPKRYNPAFWQEATI